MRLANFFLATVIAAALAGAAPVLDAQQITAATRAIRGKLVVKPDAGTTFNIGAGNVARFRPQLAVASRILDVLKHDAGFASPVGYEMHAWRMAGPNEAPLDRFFPSYSGVNSVLLYYYHDDRSVATHGVEMSDEGPAFEVLVNRPSCVFASVIHSDADGPMYVAAPRSEDYRGFPSFGERGECIVITAGTRSLTVPVSRERLLRALIHTARTDYDKGHAELKQLRAERTDSAVASEYHEWLAQRPERNAMAKAIYEQMKKQNPSQAARYLRNVTQGDSIAEATFRQRMAATTNPVDEEMRTEGNRVDAVVTSRIKAMEAELAAMSIAERKLPAYLDERAMASGSGLVSPDAPDAVAVVAPNPAFLKRTVPESTPEVITISVVCRRVNGRATGSACDDTGQRESDYERIMGNLDWDALRAMVAGGR